MSGAARARRRSASGDSVPIAPFCEPWSRRWRVSLRVSTSVMRDDAVAREVGVERLLRRASSTAIGLASRTTKPATRGHAVDRFGVLGVDADVADLAAPSS